MNCIDCLVCSRRVVLNARKYPICADCFVDLLRETELFTAQMPPQKTEQQRKICWCCQNEIVLRARRHCICFDCIAQNLINNDLIRQETVKTVVVVKKKDTEVSLGGPPPLKKCDSCKCIIQQDRSIRICIDCMIKSLVDAGYIEIRETSKFSLVPHPLP